MIIVADLVSLMTKITKFQRRDARCNTVCLPMDIVPLLIHIPSQIDFGPLPHPISPLNRPSTHMGLEATT